MNNINNQTCKNLSSPVTGDCESQSVPCCQTFDGDSQMQLSQLEWIFDMAGDRLKGKVLIFGAGSETSIWAKLCNATFLEDRCERYRKLFENENAKAYMVNYRTRVDRWEYDLRNRILNTLPPEIDQQRFDVIIISGPNSRRSKDPGRVTPILHSQRLLKKRGAIFVFDINRAIEKNITREVLGEPTEINSTGRAIGFWG